MNIQQDASTSIDGSGGSSSGNVASSIWYGEDHGLIGKSILTYPQQYPSLPYPKSDLDLIGDSTLIQPQPYR